MAGKTALEKTAIANTASMASTGPDPRLLSPPRRTNGKEKRQPSITPRKFRRFFTPRCRVLSQFSSSNISPARRALRDLAAPQLNGLQTPAPSSPLRPLAEEDLVQDENSGVEYNRAKRRKIQHTPESSPCRPLSQQPPRRQIEPGLLSPLRSSQSSQEILGSEESEDEEIEQKPVKRFAPLPSRGLGAQLLQRELGGMPRAGRAYMSYPVSDWRTETADFYSQPEDVHSCTSHESRGGNCIPFCAATCHTNGLTAVGDEEGRVRLLDSTGNENETFSNIHISFQAHSNAIIDLAFSSDDLLLATASGDQTGRVIDMMTQSTIAVLQNHTASLKQVRFQPGNANGAVLATSSRDGSVQIWDLRCKGPVQELPPLPDRQAGLGYRLRQPKQGCAVNSIREAHARTRRQAQQSLAGGQGDIPSQHELPGRIGAVSVTALQFLPEGREHLLLTTCEADSSIKLWDIRSSSSKSKSGLVSITSEPTSHSHWRPFGISSLALSTDNNRLYALCKDNTVYAYSMAHLIQGYAPDLSAKDPPRRRYGAAPHHGLGPLYGFRHPWFHATSFYVKCAIRPAQNGQSELLAVGSSDGCAVLFPTAERYFRDDLSGAMSHLSLENSTIATSSNVPAASQRPETRGGSAVLQRPAFLQRTNSISNLREKLDDIPIVRSGTTLVRGHDREVGALAWTNGGNLVTVGDDFLIRCWRQDREKARDLRVGGEVGGRRWGCGYADLGEEWDGDCEEEDDDDDEC